MPFKDKTGPEGRGPRTGRGLGPCTDPAGRPKVNGSRGGGRGRGRPCLRKRVAFDPKVKYFKPQGVPLSSLEIVEISREELEAVRLKNLKNLDQKECADRMKTSPTTLQRLLAGSYEKITDALVNGKAIMIINKSLPNRKAF